MQAFRRYYTVYYCVLCLTGLWPYNESILSKIHRILVFLLTFFCIVIQVSSIKRVEVTLHNMLTMLSYTCPMMLFMIRYIGFVVNFPVVKSFMRNMQHDCDMLDNPIEAQILIKHIEKGRRIVFIFLGMSTIGICAVLALSFIPALMESKTLSQYIQMIGFFYSADDEYIIFIYLHLAATMSLGLLILSCTEALFSVLSHYLCGLFEIVGYRIRSTVDNAAMFVSTDLINLGPAVDMHQRAHELSDALGKDMVMSYLITIVTAIVSFAVNLYRTFLSLTELGTRDPEEVLVSIMVTFMHMVIMFLNNYSGQAVRNTSSQIFTETYNSAWYRIPSSSQKMLLLVLLNSLNGVQISFAGLFIPCYEGLSMMVSSSFSYFTVLYSFQ
ncbi:uncharacterized protein LOC143361049 [Halictus rubicundus]|uniref:uncharacterized protein LOC143361049 n=1 Tax=Halictus rubicundus TaxID=77578 RepID=UPI004035FE3D